MHTALSSLAPFEGACGQARVNLEIDTHAVAMLDRLCGHHQRTRDRMIEEVIERAYLDLYDWGDPVRDRWNVRHLEQIARVAALWRAGELRTFTWVLEDIGARGRPYRYAVKDLEPGHARARRQLIG